METFFIVVPLIVLIVLAAVMLSGHEDMKKEKQRRARREERRVQLKESAAKEYNAFREFLIDKFGQPTKEFTIKAKWGDWDSKENHLFIFDAPQIVVIKGKEIPYAAILGVNLTDNVTSKTTSFGDVSSSASSGSIIKRGVVGGIAGGVLGAAVGAATSKRTGETYSESTTSTIHDYTISIQLDDISEPLIEIKIKGNSSKVQEIMAVFAIILHKNNSELK